MKRLLNFDLPQAFEYFQIGREDLTRILSVALSKGADFSDIFFEHSISNYLVLQDGKVNQSQSHIDYGAGVRAVRDVQTGYAYSETGTLSDLLQAAATASNIADLDKAFSEVSILSETNYRNHYPISRAWGDVNIVEKKILLETLNKIIFDLSDKVIKVTVSISDSTTKVLYANSEGVLMADYRPMFTISASCVMEDEGQIESNSASSSYRGDIHNIDKVLLETMASELINQTLRLFLAVKPIGGEMPVVMAAGDSGILLHEAIGHAFEADFNRKKESIFCEKLGKQICDNGINIADDGTLNHVRGTINCDDEGVESQKTYIVKDGKLESFLHDRISARYYKVSPTGNGRRESFRSMPLPRMRVTYMENGNCSSDEIIASVKNGIYVDNFTNGQVQIGVGDFTFFVKNGYLIENGKITRDIKDINIIGNGPQALMDISMVADDLKIDQGAGSCGKEGQYLPVSYGIPTVLVNKLTVGGN